MLHGKKIILGITGGIAAYKTATNSPFAGKKGAEVRVIMSASAKDLLLL
jgi:phosphopantothenoylcysteine decarboxylase/phosphopantothenate--cysteine ligase